MVLRKLPADGGLAKQARSMPILWQQCGGCGLPMEWPWIRPRSPSEPSHNDFGRGPSI